MRNMTRYSVMAAVLAISIAFAQGGGASSRSRIAAEEDEASCQGYRWEQKVLRDPKARSIDLTHQNRLVRSLTSLKQPQPLPQERQAPYEYKTYRIKARMVKVSKPSDGDLEMVVKAQGRTMIAEIPHWRCTGGSPMASVMLDARRTVRREYRGPGQCVRLTGVGFWDFSHRGAGVGQAKNAFELHPVLWARFGRRRQRRC